MGDNLHEWIAHGVDDSLRVLFPGSSLPAKAMNAGDSDIKYAPVILIEVNIALGIEDVEFCPQHQLDSVELTGNTMQVSEIDGITGARDMWSVLCDSQYFQPLFFCSQGHFLQTAVGMTRCYCMRMNV